MNKQPTKKPSPKRNTPKVNTTLKTKLSKARVLNASAFKEL